MADRLGPIQHSPGSSLWAWRWLVHSDPAVRQELAAMAGRHGWDPNAIAAVIDRESGGDPAATNPKSGATGYIQFMPDTARALGTSTSALARMRGDRQLAYVETFLRGAFAAHPPAEVGDYYLAVFMPAALGQQDAYELGRKGSPVYDQNAGLDWDLSGVLDVGDVKQQIRQSYVRASGLGSLSMAAPAVGPPPRSPFSRSRSGRPVLFWAGSAMAAGAIWWAIHRRRAA